MTDPPVHLLAVAGARYTMCGLKARETYPQMLLRWLPAHRVGHAHAGHPLVVCPACEREVP